MLSGNNPLLYSVIFNGRQLLELSAIIFAVIVYCSPSIDKYLSIHYTIFQYDKVLHGIIINAAEINRVCATKFLKGVLIYYVRNR